MVVVRINTDQELLVDLVQKPGTTFSVRPDSIPKVLPPEDVGPSCALDELPRDLARRASSLGLEWQDETEEPALIPFGNAEGRVLPLPVALAPSPLACSSFCAHLCVGVLNLPRMVEVAI